MDSSKNLGHTEAEHTEAFGIYSLEAKGCSNCFKLAGCSDYATIGEGEAERVLLDRETGLLRAEEHECQCLDRLRYQVFLVV